jgi:hypothetical protein
LTKLIDTAPRVLIFGSCVSRDILSFAENNRIQLADYFARSSIASIATKPVKVDDECMARIASEFQRRMVLRDLEKGFLHFVAKRRDFDFILLDLIDERFDLYEAAPDSVLTISSEFMLTRFVTPEDRGSPRLIRSGSERHRTMWKAGISCLFTVLAEHGIADRVIVNKVFWADCLGDGTPLPTEEASQRQAANQLLRWMYKELELYVPAPRWMSFSDTVLRSNAGHRWGIAPFHYTDNYYISAVAQLAQLYADRAQAGYIVLHHRMLIAWSGLSREAICRVSFLVFRDKMLVHMQPYAPSSEMHFDTAGIQGSYEIVIFALGFDPERSNKNPARRSQSVLRLQI